MPIDRVVCCGGIAEKNDLFMQIYADVIGQPMLIAGSPQTPALGAAISAAVTAGAAAGGYDDWGRAQQRDDDVKDKRFTPDPLRRAPSTTSSTPSIASCTTRSAASPDAAADLGGVMKRLLAIREAGRRPRAVMAGDDLRSAPRARAAPTSSWRPPASSSARSATCRWSIARAGVFAIKPSGVPTRS